jgi:hypothetical protein
MDEMTEQSTGNIRGILVLPAPRKEKMFQIFRGSFFEIENPDFYGIEHGKGPLCLEMIVALVKNPSLSGETTPRLIQTQQTDRSLLRDH